MELKYQEEIMKRIVGLLVVVLLSALLLSAQNKGKGTEMTGWICTSKCVKQVDGKATCDPNCKEKGGEAVFVDDQGKVTKIANQKMVKSHMGQKVRVKGEMMKDKDMMQIYEVLLPNAG